MCIRTPILLLSREHKTPNGKGHPARCQAVNARRSMAKDTQRVVDPWTRDAPPPDGNIWFLCWRKRTRSALLRRERETPHLLMVTSEFDGDGDHEKDYWKVRFGEGVVTYVWDISQSMTNLEEKYSSSVGLTYEFQVLLHYPWPLNNE